MAMKIGGKYEADQILPKHWERLAEEVDYAFPALKKLIIKQGEAILNSLEKNKSFFLETTQNSPMLQKINSIVQNRVEKTLNYW
jgi:hypothetical protein